MYGEAVGEGFLKQGNEVRGLPRFGNTRSEVQ